MKPRHVVFAALLAAALGASVLLVESRWPVAAPRVVAQPPSKPPIEELPRLWRLPKFSFPDQDGRTVALADLRGHPFIADFIFTQCRSACPILTARMKMLQRKLAGTDVRFVSFSVDPENDTSEALKTYARQWNGDEARWRLLRTQPDTLRAVAAGFRVMVGASGIADDPIMHSAKFFLVDREGEFVRGFYDSGDETDLARLVSAAALLARPAPQPPVDGAQGAALFVSLGCRGCHSRPEVAPPLGGLFGEPVRLEGGKSVVADETYLRESIVSPQAKLVAGYGPTMPAYEEMMSEEQLASLVKYLETIPAAPAPATARHTETDPVCGMRISVSEKDRYVDRGGKRYWFCSDSCRKAFLARSTARTASR